MYTDNFQHLENIVSNSRKSNFHKFNRYMIKKYTAFNFFVFFLLSVSSLRSDVIARLIKVNGTVYFKRLGMETFSEKAKPGAAIINGDQIKIGDVGFAVVIYIDDRSIIKIKENTKFSFMDSPNTRTIDLIHGTL